MNNNVNSNTNNVNVKVNIEHPKEKINQKSSEPNWYKRTIISGVIGLILSLCGYYIKKNMNEETNDNPTEVTRSSTLPIQGQKQN